MRKCYELNGLAFPIKLDQHGRESFRVTYGMQVEDRLTYAQAASALGRAIMHALACESRLDNRDRGER